LFEEKTKKNRWKSVKFYFYNWKERKSKENLLFIYKNNLLMKNSSKYIEIKYILLKNFKQENIHLFYSRQALGEWWKLAFFFSFVTDDFCHVIFFLFKFFGSRWNNLYFECYWRLTGTTQIVLDSDVGST
jgi:hypothetical protein